MLDGNDVDMLAEAREAQWSSLTFMGPDAIKVLAPAKVNLFFDVERRRDDGYHDVLNVMHSLALHDDVYMRFDPEDVGSESLSIDIETVVKDSGSLMSADTDRHFRIADIAADTERNLAAKAARKLADAIAAETGRTISGRLSIRIEKHIPSEAGLGGGSSDAAASIVGAAHLWDIDKDSPIVRSVASETGADVAFFIKGGCQLLGGKGDELIRAIPAMKAPLVLVKPPVGISTAEAYARFDSDPVAIPEDVRKKAVEAKEAADVPLANNLTDAAAAIAPATAEIASFLSASDGVRRTDDGADVLLCGSGSAVFAICDTYNDALGIATEMQRNGWWSRATTFSSLPAAKVG